MLPTFQRHLGRYAVALWFGLTLLCLLLAFALVRNSAELGLTQLLLAGAAITAGVSFGAFRDAPGYWIYSTLAPKFMMSRDELSAVRNLQITPVLRWLNPLQSPLGMPVLLTLSVLLLLVAGYSLFPGQRGVVVMVVMGGLFPLLLCWLLLGSARYFLVLASPEGENTLRQGQKRLRQAASFRREDLIITLAINWVLIWPLQDKPEFSLAAGYGTPEFMVAAVLLIWIAGFFTLLGARRSRLFSRVGEGLSSLFSVEAVSARPVRPLLQRLLAYYGVLALWTLGCCLVLSLLPLVLPFALFCVLLLPALGWVFWQERGVTLQRDAEQATQFIDEQAVQPVAVPRRMAEFN